VATVWFQIPFSELAVMAILSIRSIETLKHTQTCRQAIASTESAYWSTQEQIATLASMQERRDGKLIPSLTKGCAFENVSFEHDVVPIVQDISLSIPANDITVLIGPSGAGKTTIVDLLLGLLTPKSGRITIDGTPLEQLDLGRWRRMVGYVPQETTLLHGTLRQNVTLDDPAIKDDDIQKALQLSGADRFVNRLPDGLETIAGEMGTRFSGGERQRIALARALVLQPKLLLLDEVTSALDPEIELEICANIAELRGKLTIIAVTHREAWTSIAGRIYRVEHGSAQLVSSHSGSPSLEPRPCS
jgi:ATP-binding cassette subfamily C protein